MLAKNIYRSCLLLLVSSLASVANAVPTEGTQIIISAPSAYAVEAGKAISRRGGNLVDVAVAVGLTLTVTNPSNASLGGGGFALLRMGRDVEVLDFREKAPSATSPEFYLQREKGASWNGGAAVGVPGVAAGLWALHEKYGDLSWRQLFRTALRLAEQGIEFSGTESRYLESQKERFNQAGLEHFYQDSGQHYRPGDLFKQPALARALKKLRDEGPEGFYQGEVAADIAASVQAADGVITERDLERYRVRWLEPLQTEFRGHKIYTMPPLLGGGMV